MVKAWSFGCSSSKGLVFGAALLAAAGTVAASAAADSLDKFRPGVKFENNLELPLFSIPLPKGSWTTAYFTDWRDNNKNKLIEIGLTKNDGRIVTEMVIVSTNVDAAGAGWPTNGVCSQNNMLFNTVVSNAANHQECWGVNHHVWRESVDFKPTLGVNMQQFARNLGLEFPATTLANFFRLANKSAFVNFHHYVNPSAFHVKDQRTGWAESMWHKDRVFEDPKRVSIVDQMREEGEDLYLRAKAAGYF